MDQLGRVFFGSWGGLLWGGGLFETLWLRCFFSGGCNLALSYVRISRPGLKGGRGHCLENHNEQNAPRPTEIPRRCGFEIPDLPLRAPQTTVGPDRDAMADPQGVRLQTHPTTLLLQRLHRKPPSQVRRWARPHDAHVPLGDEVRGARLPPGYRSTGPANQPTEP